MRIHLNPYWSAEDLCVLKIVTQTVQQHSAASFLPSDCSRVELILQPLQDLIY